MGDSDQLQIGDFVVAIGHPFNLGQAAALGIVSGLHRRSVGMFRYEDFVQTDATINLGDSGGALATLDGKVIGINTLVLSGAAASPIGFAIPVNAAQAIARQLVTFGDVRRGDIGMKVAAPTDAAQASAVIASVVPGASAERAGLQTGDVITAVDGRALRGTEDLRNRLSLIRQGGMVELLALRGGTPFTTRVQLAEAPVQLLGGKELNPLLEGVAFAVVTSMIEGIEDEIEVYSVDRASEAWRSGLRKGDLVMAVNQERIDGAQDLTELVHAARARLAMTVRRQGRTTLVLLQ
jgi:S1-C subfamily serine protease